jgi:hypothetical protein
MPGSERPADRGGGGSEGRAWKGQGARAGEKGAAPQQPLQARQQKGPESVHCRRRPRRSQGQTQGAHASCMHAPHQPTAGRTEEFSHKDPGSSCDHACSGSMAKPHQGSPLFFFTLPSSLPQSSSGLLLLLPLPTATKSSNDRPGGGGTGARGKREKESEIACSEFPW